MASGQKKLSSRSRQARLILSVLFCAAIAWAIGRELRAHASTLSWATIYQHRLLFLVTLLCQVVSVFINYAVWGLLINRNERLLAAKESYRIFTISALSRYLPAGKIWQLMSLLHLQENPRMKAEVTFCFLMNVLLSLLGGALAASLGMSQVLPQWGPSSGVLMAGATMLVLMLLSQRHLPSRLSAILSKRIKTAPDLFHLPRRTILLASLLYPLMWVAQAVAAMSLLSILGIPRNEMPVTLILSSYYLAILFGLFAFIAPAGLGAREGAFMVLLQSHVGVSNAAFLAVGMRLSAVLGDLLFTLPLLWDLTRKKFYDRDPVANLETSNERQCTSQ